MLFNSIEFVVFLPIIFLLYWFLTNKNLKVQNVLIVLVSYVFCGWWDRCFLTLDKIIILLKNANIDIYGVTVPLAPKYMP